MNTTLLMLEGEAGKVIRYSEWTFADRVSEALKTSVLGIATVFAVLAIIWGILELFKVFVYDIPNKNKGAKTEVKEEKPAPAPVSAPAPVLVSSDEEIVAAITAAISVMMDRPTTSFRVVSFRKTGTK